MNREAESPNGFLAGHYEREAQKRYVGSVVAPRMDKVIGLFRRHGPTKVERILDIGCGVGEITIHLKEALGAKEAHGVEISGPRLTAARKRGVIAARVDLNNEPLPYSDGHFDAVFCGEFLEHVVNPDHLVREIKRVQKDDGLCVLTTPNLSSWYNRIFLFLGWQPDTTGISLEYPVKGRPIFFDGPGDEALAHLRVYTFRGLLELLHAHEFIVAEANGLKMKESQPNPTVARSVGVSLVMPFVRFVDSILGSRPSLTQSIVVALRKAPQRFSTSA